MRVCPTYGIKRALLETANMNFAKTTFALASLVASTLATAADRLTDISGICRGRIWLAISFE